MSNEHRGAVCGRSRTSRALDVTMEQRGLTLKSYISNMIHSSSVYNGALVFFFIFLIDSLKVCITLYKENIFKRNIVKVYFKEMKTCDRFDFEDISLLFSTNCRFY